MGSKELFFYELEGRGYIFQNKKWDEAKHGFEDDMLNMAWEMWSSAKHSTKAKAVPEGFVLAERKRLADAVDGIEKLFKEDNLLALGELLPIQQDLNAMIEAQEQAND